ncbi:hypothetical protein [Actinomadura barringtoniae]|uniref:hypothetical protein n=1 Tax=Actinomadura barringtoniae TaxID=1427535 RepID=UPI0027DE9C72|nr:hypothetical protein [Actinomadura barringtoniae]
MEAVRPSASVAPSIWYAEVATPQRKLGGSPEMSVTGLTLESRRRPVYRTF